jgi:hypothetical protein
MSQGCYALKTHKQGPLNFIRVPMLRKEAGACSSACLWAVSEETGPGVGSGSPVIPHGASIHLEVSLSLHGRLLPPTAGRARLAPLRALQLLSLGCFPLVLGGKVSKAQLLDPRIFKEGLKKYFLH